MDGQNNPNAGENNSQNQSTNPAPTLKADNNTVLAVLSYLGPLVIISYLLGKDNEFVRFHSKQGMVVFGFEIVMWVLGSMMYLYFVMNLLNLATLILSIIGIVNAIKGEKKELPFVGGLAHNINF